MADRQEYKNIFKSTILFGFVQVFVILMRVILNKAVALILGPSGMGTIGLFQNSVSMLKTGAGLGISESAIKDISEANRENDCSKFSKIITTTNKVIIFTSVFGVIITIALSPYLSKWTFNSYHYTIPYIVLSIAVGFQIYSDGQLAILKGMRQLKNLALASVIGSIAGVVFGVPLYYFFGDSGIVPSLVIVSLTAFICSNYFVSKIPYEKYRIRFWHALKSSGAMIKMGISLMIVSFVVTLFNLVISAYISHTGGLYTVGLYQAGALIITGYFGIIITAMRTDYYPRISAISQNNVELQSEFNRQSEIGLVLVYPFSILFIFLSATFIKILYNSDFEQANAYTDYAFIGTLITIVSNCLALILLAKQASKIFLWAEISQRLLLVGIYILFYNLWGLRGLGLSYIVLSIIHYIVMTLIMKKTYGIITSKRTLILLVSVIVTSLLTIYIRELDNTLLKFSLGGSLFVFSLFFCHIYMSKFMGLNILTAIKHRIKH